MRWAIGVAQSAGFKLAEIRELIEDVDSADGMGGRAAPTPRRRNAAEQMEAASS
jgi:DNA-binding transcriptional MerR regulator